MSQETEFDFFRARNRAFINEVTHVLDPKEANLLSFNDIRQVIKPQNETYVGMQTIPINKIVGSEGRYKDFDNQFFPKSSFMKDRWERVDDAVIKDVILPPIMVYELAGLYFVRDGNHRVSVAKAKGVEYIDAEVVSLRTEIKLKAAKSPKDIIKQIINYEKRNFYFETSFGDITDYWNLNFSVTGQYDIILQHILTHKYYINEAKKEEVSMEEAVRSWFESVYTPVAAIIEKYHLARYIKKYTTDDLYIWLMNCYNNLKEKFGDDVALDIAVNDFKRAYKFSFFRRVNNFWNKLLFRKKV